MGKHATKPRALGLLGHSVLTGGGVSSHSARKSAGVSIPHRGRWVGV